MGNKDLRKICFLLIAIIVFFLTLTPNIVQADNSENSTLIISADIKEPTAKIEITPSSINLGEITKGFSTDANKTRINFTNTGDLDVNVSTLLDDGADPIFENLEFGRTDTCSSGATYDNISEWDGFTLNGPSEYNGVGETKETCIRLNLEDYSGEIGQTENLTTQIVFWVMPA
ncbi:MAG: hypothetical protein WDZ62_01135 [Candidatus Pacearchaeota archaeon]